MPTWNLMTQEEKFDHLFKMLSDVLTIVNQQGRRLGEVNAELKNVREKVRPRLEHPRGHA
jgi:hypothetical protein